MPCIKWTLKMHLAVFTHLFRHSSKFTAYLWSPYHNTCYLSWIASFISPPSAWVLLPYFSTLVITTLFRLLRTCLVITIFLLSMPLRRVSFLLSLLKGPLIFLMLLLLAYYWNFTSFKRWTTAYLTPCLPRWLCSFVIYPSGNYNVVLWFALHTSMYSLLLLIYLLY